MTNILWSAIDAQKATRGKLQGRSWAASGVSIDTRTLQKGDLFIALKGDAGDGHTYVQQALAKGAACAVVSRVPDGLAPDAPLLLVPDTFIALEDLGRFARARTGAKCVAITGSVGKTGTKEMLGVALAAQGQAHWSQKSYNNHWGVPLSLALMPAGADYGVFEVGMNHAHEITPLSKMVQPKIAIITTVAAVHTENFANGIEGVADAKSEVFEGLEASSIAIINRDMDQYARVLAHARTKGVRALTFGEHAQADACMLECLEAANGTRVRARIEGTEYTYTLKDAGKHQAMNALAVLLAVKNLGADVAKAIHALAQIEPVAGRGKREQINVGDPKNPITLIDESYNANPTAMRAAFRVVALIDPGRGGRRIAVLGDMLELGQDSARMHAELAMPLKAANIDLVYTAGPLMRNLHEALPANQRGVHKETSAELAEIVPDVLVPGDVVMIKGSRGSRMDLVVEALRRMPKKFNAHAQIKA